MKLHSTRSTLTMVFEQMSPRLFESSQPYFQDDIYAIIRVHFWNFGIHFKEDIRAHHVHFVSLASSFYPVAFSKYAQMKGKTILAPWKSFSSIISRTPLLVNSSFNCDEDSLCKKLKRNPVVGNAFSIQGSNESHTWNRTPYRLENVLPTVKLFPL